jgi:hypothetical protein
LIFGGPGRQVRHQPVDMCGEVLVAAQESDLFGRELSPVRRRARFAEAKKTTVPRRQLECDDERGTPSRQRTMRYAVCP